MNCRNCRREVRHAEAVAAAAAFTYRYGRSMIQTPVCLRCARDFQNYNDHHTGHPPVPQYYLAVSPEGCMGTQ